MTKPWDMTPDELRTEADRLQPSWDTADREDASFLQRQLEEQDAEATRNEHERAIYAYFIEKYGEDRDAYNLERLKYEPLSKEQLKEIAEEIALANKEGED